MLKWIMPHESSVVSILAIVALQITLCYSADFGDDCTTKDNCTYTGASCDGTTCGCDSTDYFINQTACVMKYTYGDAPCNTQGFQGAVCGSNLVCDGTGKCMCNSGNFWSGSQCLTQLTYGDTCNTAAFKGIVCGSNLVCDGTGGKCACDSGKFWSGSQCLAQLTYGDTCNTAAFKGIVCGSSLVCDGTGGKCACDSGKFWSGSQCVAQLTYGDTCNTAAFKGIVCGSNLVCDGTGGKCACDSGKFWSGSQCLAQLTYGDTCNTAAFKGIVCGSNLVCDGTGGKCACDSGKFWSGSQCLAQYTYEGTSCNTQGFQGTVCGSNLICDGTGKCACESGKFWSGSQCSNQLSYDGVCEAVGYKGTVCKSNLACSATTKKCVCNAGQFWSGTACVSQLTYGDTCNTSAFKGTVCGSNLVCDVTGGKCACGSGKFWSGSQCLDQKTYGDTTCNMQGYQGIVCGSNLVCDGTKCTCDSGKFWSGSQCLNQLGYGVNCGSNQYQGTVCSSNLRCLSNICNCQSGYYWSGSSCLVVAGPTVSVTTVTVSGTSIILGCLATGGSPAVATITWKKDGVAINVTSSGGKYTGSTTSKPSLTITNAGNSDIGTYKCSASNTQVTIESVSSLSVDLPSVSITGPNSIVYGETVTYTSTLTSSPQASSAVWQKVIGTTTSTINLSSSKYTGSSLDVLTGPKLLINAAKFEDEAKYQLVITNLIGSKTSNQIILDVTGVVPSVSVSGPSDSGRSVTLTCYPSVTPESPPLSAITWIKDDTNLNIAGNPGKYTGGSTSVPSLTITNVDSNDKGEYKCSASNAIGSTLSNGAVTLAIPSVIMTGSSSILYAEDITYNAQVTSSLTVLSVKWQKVATNGDVSDIAISSTKYVGSSVASSGPRLVINDAEFADESSYRCVATNLIGVGNSIQIALDVTGALPTVTISGESTRIYGESITYTGVITSVPAALVIKWQKVSGGQTTDIDINQQKYSGSSVSPTAPKLVINSVTFVDEAFYELKVTNAVGHKTSNRIAFNVTGAIPSITLSGSNSVEYGQTVTYTATVTASPAASADGVWQKGSGNTYTDININDAKYSGSSTKSASPSLVIKSLTYSDETSYRFTVSNLVGPGNSNSIQLDVTGTPVHRAVRSLNASQEAEKDNPALTNSSTLTNTSTSPTSMLLNTKQAKPTVAITANPSTTVQFGNTLTITSTVTANPPVNTSAWQIKSTNGVWTNIDLSNSKYTGSSTTPGSPVLKITSIRYEDEAAYRCTVGNAEGNTISNELTIDVTGNLSSIAVTPSGPLTVNHGTVVQTLTANVTAGANTQPASQAKWQKVGQTVTDIDISDPKYAGSTVSLPKPVLNIRNVMFTDEAEYQCQALNTEGWGTSNKVRINVIGGALTVTTGANVQKKIGESVTISCTVTGPETNKITWKKTTGNTETDVIIDNNNNNKYAGGSVSTPSLTINNLVLQDAAQYQCTAVNPGGTYRSTTKAALTVTKRQFQDNCSSTLPCDETKYLTCSADQKCVCQTTHYHKNGTCYQRSILKPTVITTVSTTSQFTVNWNPPSTDASLVSSYSVNWKVHGASQTSSDNVGLQITKTISSSIIPGKLYMVYITSHVSLRDPQETITVNSDISYIRIVPLPPGSIKKDQSNMDASRLQLTWNVPVSGTEVTKYEVTINGTTQLTSSTTPDIIFTKTLIAGRHYNVSIVTVSGDSGQNGGLKKSTAYIEQIRTTPTKPGPPTGITCPAIAKDISLEISWTPTTSPNGDIKSYKIEIENAQGQPVNTVNTPNNVNKYDITGLSEEQTYVFFVRTVNDAAENIRESDRSQGQNCTTKAGVSTPPQNVAISSVTSRTLKITFERPSDVKGVLSGYRVMIMNNQDCWQEILILCSSCQQPSIPQVSCQTKKTSQVPDINVQSIPYDVTGLHPYITYEVKVAAINGAGEGNFGTKSETTKQEEPKKPSLSGTVKSATAIDLSWTLEAPSPGNVTYTLIVYEGNDAGNAFPELKMITINGFTIKSSPITGLEEYWRYKFAVKAETIIGSKTSDMTSAFTTNQAAAGNVTSFDVQKMSANIYTTVIVRWKLPKLRERNGVLAKYVFISNRTGSNQEKDVPIPSNVEDFTAETITVIPETYYYFGVYLVNTENMNGSTIDTVYWAPPGPPPTIVDDALVPTKPGEHSPTQTTIKIQVDTNFFTNNQNGAPVYFGVAVCAICSDSSSASQLPTSQQWKDLPNWYNARSRGFPLYRVFDDSFMNILIQGNNGRRRKRSTPQEITIGNDTSCATKGDAVYCNGPLDAGKSYKVVVFVCTNGGCTSSSELGPYATLDIPDEKPPGAIIGGAVGGGVAVFAGVFILIIVIRRKRHYGKANKYKKEVDEPPEIVEDIGLSKVPKKRPIRVGDIAAKVAEKHKDSNLLFAREYEDLKQLSPKHNTGDSELDENKLKNRYVNILPFDHSRVKLLLTEDDDPSTDFINANYLPGYKSQREYIATQGPIPGTIDDFWRMVWEQNVSIVVMLTLCKEEGRVKCEMYWPENLKEPKQYGDLVVETISNSTVNFYDFRIFKIKLGDTTRTLKHFHFLQWKDFSANVQNDVMIDFIKNVRNHIRPPDMNGPVIVHCSAGVGRTGTYCALDHLFQFIDDHDFDSTIDIFDLVLNLREQRMFMVQTEQQYVFIHDCVRDYIERNRREMRGDFLYENVNKGFVQDEPPEESLYQNTEFRNVNQRTDL